MDDAQELRYSRHLLLDDWPEAAQERLLAAHAVVIGAGGLGAPALLYLASAGVGRITVIDPDTVELSNLQRQIAHSTERIGQPKVDSARTAMAEINPEVQVQALAQAADEALLADLLPQADVVLDCTDTFATRQLVNRLAWRAGVPLVSASALRWDGQISVFDPRRADSPCYACLFPPDAPPEETRCALLGVFAPVVGLMGVMQAGEALKLLAGQGDARAADTGTLAGHTSLAGQLLMLDGRDWSWTRLRVKRDPACPVCGAATCAEGSP
ncbi:HesA/MoeB/ThiF family protein [Aquabacterium sp.]|uniref:HesA/MoeB/ThiF family protein n=1 Tax=Aquabacterium sp. TaxID=1872578 RepID=UPI002488C24B|nr:HesA/MoeB/ThiF family protein [Aquabacterium sp.]MDI1348481.1 HesA/MoeB/ThiF family protein [Aquabacterium sp.]